MSAATLERAIASGAPVWRAQARQSVFLRAPEFEVLYGGAAGGGKTDALLVHGLMVADRYPGAKVMFLRRTFADLSKQGAAIDRSHELYRGHGTWNGQEHRWTFRNGSSLQFGHLQDATTYLDYRGAQFDCLLWDELTQFSESQYLFLKSRVRATGDGIRTSVRAATNPGDVGHAWVKRRWVDAAVWGEPFVIRTEGGTETSARFVPAKVQDNPALLQRNPEYVQQLADLPEHLRRAYLDGDWDIYEGQYFAEWRRELHVVAPFAIPADWPRWLAVDYGFADPFCCLWLARDPQTRRRYVYREAYGPGLRDEEQAGLVRAKSEGERIVRRVADPSLFNARNEQGKPSIANVYAAHGVPLERASNNRVAGWQAVRRALAVRDDGLPGLQVFDTCVNLIRTLPTMVHDSLDPEDLADTVRRAKTEDHAADCLRYALMGEAPVVAAEPLPYARATQRPAISGVRAFLRGAA